MRDLIFRLSKDGLVTFKRLTVGLVFLIGLTVTCFGQRDSLTPSAGGATYPWVEGPAKADLNPWAEVQVPAGFRFLSGTNAKSYLMVVEQRLVRSDLVGVWVRKSDQSRTPLYFLDQGYFKPEYASHVDASGIMKNYTKDLVSSGAQPALAREYLTWLVEPKYNATNNSVVYAMGIKGPSAVAVQQKALLFGRHGVFLALLSQRVANPATEMMPIEELIAGLSFKEGQRYADYQAGDKLALTDAYGVLSNDPFRLLATDKSWKAYFLEQKTILGWEFSRAAWGSMLLGVLIFVFVIYMIAQELRAIKVRHGITSLTKKRQPMVAKVNKTRRPTKLGDNAKRHRAYDYQKFYSDMMNQVATRSYTGIHLKKDEQPAEEVDGISTVPPAHVEKSELGTVSELIAQQKDFIEEQRRLMQQQTKLIEERNQLLAKQAEMIENHSL